jgi:HAD superfamily hydrolase (TIGR01509 family)
MDVDEGRRQRPLQDCRAVLFDLDGTLIDAVESHYRVFARVLGAFDIRLEHPAFKRHYSPNWYVFYKRMGLPERRWPEADQLWLRYYAEEIPARCDGADEALAAVRTSGRALGLITAGDRTRVQRDLRRLGWSALFDVTVCAGDVAERKPHPAPLVHGLIRLEVPPNAAVYIGDTVEDVEMGKAAGVPTLGVLGGFSSAEALEAASPQGVLRSLRDLLALL